MTVEQIIGCKAAEIKAMTDDQLSAYFAPYLDVTRPERAAVKHAAESAAKRQKVRTGKVDPALEAIAKLQQFGIDFGKL